MKSAIEITNLREFQAALREAVDASPRELGVGIRRAGEPIVLRAGELAPKVTGALAHSFRATSSGTTGRIVSNVPYGAGSEWGTRGKWAGFLKYGGPGRFAWKATEEKADEVMALITAELSDLVTMHGWAT